MCKGETDLFMEGFAFNIFLLILQINFNKYYGLACFVCHIVMNKAFIWRN